MLEKFPESIGHVLRDTRAGLDHIAFNRIDLRSGAGAITLSSLAFADHASIPALYTADGEGVSPPLDWTGIAPGATELLLIVEDADSPTPMPLVHAIVTGLPAGDGHLPEGAIDPESIDAQEATIGRNSYLRRGWLAPDPPPGHGVHRYAFQLFALAPGEAIDSVPGREAALALLRDRAIASGLLIGTYTRQDGTLPLAGARAAVASP